eukprot:scaffold1360_cov20-Tisochrysis_lutea.AAC.7
MGIKVKPQLARHNVRDGVPQPVLCTDTVDRGEGEARQRSEVGGQLRKSEARLAPNRDRVIS